MNTSLVEGLDDGPMPLTAFESRTSACVEAAQMVQLYCVGAAEDRGMADASPFLAALHCTNVLRG